MKIERFMDIDAVAERMGTEATRDEAIAMIDILLVGDYTDTDQIPEDKWLEYCELAVEGVAHNAWLEASRL